MNTPLLERLAEHCHRLRLYQVEQELTARLEQAATRELSDADFVDQLLALEVGSNTEQHHQMRITMARFPFHKTLESFDFKFQPSIDPKLIRELATGRDMQRGDNVLLLGPPGIGQTHLAVALGIKACEQGVRTLLVTAPALITTLGRALAAGRLEERLKVLTQPQLLIVDEIGYLPIDGYGQTVAESSPDHQLLRIAAMHSYRNYRKRNLTSHRCHSKNSFRTILRASNRNTSSCAGAGWFPSVSRCVSSSRRFVLRHMLPTARTG